MKCRFLILLVMLGLPGRPEADIYFEVGLETGGETLGSTRREDLDAGGGIKLALGLKKYIGGFDDVGLVFSLGFLFDYIDASNGDAETDATVLELTYFRDLGPHRFGVGGSYHLNPQYEDDLVGLPRTKIDFDDAPGVFVRYGYVFISDDAGQQAEIGIRYTVMDYEVGGESIDAGGFGIFVSGSF